MDMSAGHYSAAHRLEIAHELPAGGDMRRKLAHRVKNDLPLRGPVGLFRCRASRELFACVTQNIVDCLTQESKELLSAFDRAERTASGVHDISPSYYFINFG
jgi:hypothetical protein